MSTEGAAPSSPFEALRRDTPVLAREIAGRPCVYLDSAATALKPTRVIRAVTAYYEELSANVHRGRHLLSEEATDRFEAVRGVVARFVGAAPADVVFTSGTTHAINLVAHGLGLGAGDNVVSTMQEHHSLLLPFMAREGVALRLAAVDASGRLDAERVIALIDDGTKLVALAGASNVTGAVHDLAGIIDAARVHGARVLLDGAQSVPHLPTRMAELGVDYLAFSGHKALGPTGTGALVARAGALEALAPTLLGGGSPRLVTPSGFTLKGVPYRFEAGTPNIAGVLGLGEALTILDELGMQRVFEHGMALRRRMLERLADVRGVRVLGPPVDVPALPIVTLALELPGVGPEHCAQVLSDAHGVLVRAGHHCCHPFFDGLGVSGGLRASAYAYTTMSDVDVFVDALDRVLSVFRARR